MQEETVERDDASILEVLHVLLLLQGAIGVLGGLAMLLFMGANPLVMPISLGTPILLFVVAAGMVRRRRWAFKAARVVQILLLVGFALSFLIGLLAAVDFSINLLTIITNVVMPFAMIRLLRRSSNLMARPESLPGVEPQTIATTA